MSDNKKKPKRKPKPLSRKIHINGRVWTYFVGKSHVKIRNPECSCDWVASMYRDLGIELPDAWDMKRQPVTPAIVKDFIIKRLIPRQEAKPKFC